MILLVHMLLGALIGQKIANPIFAVFLAYFSHYFLDFFPHIEYSFKNITDKKWKKSLPDFLKIFLDFSAGVILIFLLTDANLIICACAILAILPDGFSSLELVFENRILNEHNNFHQKKIHYLKYKKIPVFWRIFSQAIIALACIFLFIY